MEKGTLQHMLRIDALFSDNWYLGVIIIKFMQQDAIYQSEAFGNLAIML